MLVAQAVGAAATGSLALLADAGHLATDAVGLAAALGAAVLATRPPSARRTYGLGRAEVLVAAANALLLLGVAGWVAVTAVSRLDGPRPSPARRCSCSARSGSPGTSPRSPSSPAATGAR